MSLASASAAPHAGGTRDLHDDWVAETRRRTLPALLKTALGLTALFAAIAVATSEPVKAAISLTGVAAYATLLSRLEKWPASRIAYGFAFAFNAIALLYVAHGRGIYSVTMVLVPAGMFIAALLLRRVHVLVLFPAVILAVVAIGSWKVMRPGAGVLDAPVSSEIVVVAAMLLVAGAVAVIIVDAIRSTLRERAQLAAEAVRAQRETESHSRSLELIADLSHRLQARLDLEGIAREAIAVLEQLSTPPLVAVYLLNDTRDTLELIAQKGFEERGEIGRKLPVVGSLSGVAIDHGSILYCADVATDGRVEPRVQEWLVEQGIRTVLSIPLRAVKSIGTLNLFYYETRSFTMQELATFESVGQAVALGIANAKHLANLEHHAYHDPLTDLPNRARLFRDFEEQLVGLREDEKLALAVVNLQRFRVVNDTLGHVTGDHLLGKVAARLIACARPLGARVYRIGGGEFAALVTIAADGDAERLSRELVTSMREPIEVGALSLTIGASAGFALSPDHAVTADQTLRCAEVALRSAKEGNSGVERYSIDIDRNAPQRLALLADLGRALSREEILLHYQPIVELESAAIVGFEALVRWQHPTLGLLSPSAFLPLAEESDLIHELTDRTVSIAMDQLRRWHSRWPWLRMAVNLSPRTLLDRNCSHRMLEIIRGAGVDPARVVFELTETAVMADRELATTLLGRITETGARLTIDDFGTGYSSLTYLRHFPVTGIKIDRSFVGDMTDGGHSHAIVRSTVQLAQSLAMTVVAEGIENASTADALREIGCRYAQGHYFGRPTDAASSEALLDDSAVAPS